eukprot:gene15444-18319_t
MVITANHVVKNELVDLETQETGTLCGVYIYFGVVATYIEVDPHCIQELDDAYELSLVTPLRNSRDWNKDKDISILKFTSNRMPPGSDYLLPSDATTEDNCYVIGYPSLNRDMLFQDDFEDSTTELSNNLYEQISSQPYFLDHKVVSTSNQCSIQKDGLLTHLCPTLKGTSGGLFGVLGKSTFTGIHIGGELGHNYAISVQHPSFIQAYLTHVVTESFMEKHRQDLVPLVDRYQQLVSNSILPSGLIPV